MSEKFLKVLNVVNNKLNPSKERKVTDINGLVEGVDIKKLTPSFTNLRGINIQKVGLCNIFNPKKNKKLNEILFPISSIKGLFIFENKFYGYNDFLVFEIDFCSLKIKKIVFKNSFPINSITEYRGKLIVGGERIAILNENFEKEKEFKVGFGVSSLTEYKGKLVVGGERIAILNENFEKEKEIEIGFWVGSLTEYKGKLVVGGGIERIAILNENFEKEKEFEIGFWVNSLTEYKGKLVVGGERIAILNENFEKEKEFEVGFWVSSLTEYKGNWL